MERGAQGGNERTTASRILLIAILIALGALGGWFITKQFQLGGGAIRGHDDRPPIIVQGGSAVIDVPFGDAVHNSKGEWEPVGSSGKHRYKHAAGGTSKVINVVTPADGCVDYKAVRGADLTFTLVSKTDPSKMWTFDVRNDGGNLVVDPGSAEVIVKRSDAWRLTITVQTDPADPSTLVPTDLKAVEPKGNAAKKCTFAVPKPSVEIIQIS